MQASMSEVVLPLNGRDDEEVHQNENDDLSVPLDPSGFNYGHSSGDNGKDKDEDIIDRTLGLIFGDDFAHNQHHSTHPNIGFVRDDVPVEQEALRSSEPKNHDYSTEPYPTWDEGESEFNNYFQSYAPKHNASGTHSPPVTEKGLCERLGSHDYSLDVLPALVQEKLAQGYTFEESLNPLTAASNGNSLQEEYFDEISEDLKDCKSFYESQSTEISSEGSPEDVSPSCSSMHTVPLSDGMMDVVTHSPTEEYGSPVGMDAGVGKNVVIEMSQVSSPDVARVPTSDHVACQPMSPPSYRQSMSYLSSECCGPHGAVVANKIVLPYSGEGILSENDSIDSLDYGPPDLDPVDDRQNCIIDQPNEFPPMLTPINTIITSTSKVTVQAIPSAAGEDLVAAKKLSLGVVPETSQEVAELSSPDELNVSLGKIVPSITTDISDQIPTGYIMNDVYNIRNITPDTSSISVGPHGSGSLPALLPTAYEPKSFRSVSKSSRSKKSQFSSDIRALTRFDSKEAELRKKARELLESNPNKLDGHEKVSVKIAIENFPTGHYPGSLMVQGPKVGESSNDQTPPTNDITKQLKRVTLRPIIVIKDKNVLLQPTVRKILAVTSKPIANAGSPSSVAPKETLITPVPSKRLAIEQKAPALKEKTVNSKPNPTSNPTKVPLKQGLKVSLPLNLLSVKPLTITESQKTVKTPEKERSVENFELNKLDQNEILSTLKVSVPFLLPVTKPEVSPSKPKTASEVVGKLKKVSEPRPAPVAVKISNKDINIDGQKCLSSGGVTMTVRAVKPFIVRETATELSPFKPSTNDVHEPKEGTTPVNDKCQGKGLNGKEASTANEVNIAQVLSVSELESKAVEPAVTKDSIAVPNSCSERTVDCLEEFTAKSEKLSNKKESVKDRHSSQKSKKLNPLIEEGKVNLPSLKSPIEVSHLGDGSQDVASKIGTEFDNPTLSLVNSFEVEKPVSDQGKSNLEVIGDIDPRKPESKSSCFDVPSEKVNPSQSSEPLGGSCSNDEVKVHPVLEQLVIEMIESSRSPQVVVEPDKQDLEEQMFDDVSSQDNCKKVPQEGTGEPQNLAPTDPILSTNATASISEITKVDKPCEEVNSVSVVHKPGGEIEAAEDVFNELKNVKVVEEIPRTEIEVDDTCSIHETTKCDHCVGVGVSQPNIELVTEKAKTVSENYDNELDEPQNPISQKVELAGMKVTQSGKKSVKNVKDDWKKKKEMLAAVVTERTSKIMQNACNLVSELATESYSERASPENEKLDDLSLKTDQSVSMTLGKSEDVPSGVDKSSHLNSLPSMEQGKRPRTRSETSNEKKLLDDTQQSEKSDPNTEKPLRKSESFPSKDEKSSSVRSSSTETKDFVDVSNPKSMKVEAPSVQKESKVSSDCSTPIVAVFSPRTRGKIERKPATVKTIPATPKKGVSKVVGETSTSKEDCKKNESNSEYEPCIDLTTSKITMEDEESSCSKTSEAKGRKKNGIPGARRSVTKRRNSLPAIDSKVEVTVVKGSEAGKGSEVKIATAQKKIGNTRAKKSGKGGVRMKQKKIIRTNSLDKMSSNDVYDFIDDEEDQAVRLQTIDHYRKASGKTTNKRPSLYGSLSDTFPRHLDERKNSPAGRITRSESTKTLNVKEKQSTISQSLSMTRRATKEVDEKAVVDMCEQRESTKVSLNEPIKLPKKLKKSPVRKPSVWTVKRVSQDELVSENPTEEGSSANKSADLAKDDAQLGELILKNCERTGKNEPEGKLDVDGSPLNEPTKSMNVQEVSTDSRPIRNTRRSKSNEAIIDTHLNNFEKNEVVSPNSLPEERPMQALKKTDDISADSRSNRTIQRSKSKEAISEEQTYSVKKNDVVTSENLSEEKAAPVSKVIEDVAVDVKSIRITRRSKSKDAIAIDQINNLEKDVSTSNHFTEEKAAQVIKKAEEVSSDPRFIRSTRRPKSKDAITDQNMDNLQNGPSKNLPEEKTVRASRRSKSKDNEIDVSIKQRENGQAPISSPAAVALRSSRRSKSREDVTSLPKPLASADASNDNNSLPKNKVGSVPHPTKSKEIDAILRDKNCELSDTVKSPQVVALRSSERVKVKEGNAGHTRPCATKDISVRSKSKEGVECSPKVTEQENTAEVTHTQTASIRNSPRSKSKEAVPCKKSNSGSGDCSKDVHKAQAKKLDCLDGGTQVSTRRTKVVKLEVSQKGVMHHNAVEESSTVPSSDDRALRASQRLRSKDVEVDQKVKLNENENNSEVLGKVLRNKGIPENTNVAGPVILSSDDQPTHKKDGKKDFEKSPGKVNDFKPKGESNNSKDASVYSTATASSNPKLSKQLNGSVAEMAVKAKDKEEVSDGSISKRMKTRSSLITNLMSPEGYSKDPNFTHENTPTKETLCNKPSQNSEDAPICPKLRSSAAKKLTGVKSMSDAVNKKVSSGPELTENKFTDGLAIEFGDGIAVADNHRLVKKTRKVDLATMLKDSPVTPGSIPKEVIPCLDNESEPHVKDKIKKAKRNSLPEGLNPPALLSQESAPCNAEPVSLKTPLMDSAGGQELESIQTVGEMTQHGEPEGASSSTRFAQLRSLLPLEDVEVRNPILQRKKHKKSRVLDRKDVTSEKLSCEVRNHVIPNSVKASKQERLHSILDPLRNAKSQKMVDETSCKVEGKTKTGDGPSKVSKGESLKFITTVKSSCVVEESRNRRITRSSLSGSSQNLALEPAQMLHARDESGGTEGATSNHQVVHPKKDGAENSLSNSEVSKNDTKSHVVSIETESSPTLDMPSANEEVVSKDTVLTPIEVNEEGILKQPTRKSSRKTLSDKTSRSLDVEHVIECAEKSKKIATAKYPKENGTSLKAAAVKEDLALRTIETLASKSKIDDTYLLKTLPSSSKSKTPLSKTKAPSKSICPTLGEKKGRIITPTKVVCEFSIEAQKLFEEVSQEEAAFDAIVQSPGKSPDSTTQNSVEIVIPGLTNDTPASKIAEDAHGVTSTTELGMSCAPVGDILEPKRAKKHKHDKIMLIRKEDEGVSSTTADSKALEISSSTVEESEPLIETPSQTSSARLVKDNLPNGAKPVEMAEKVPKPEQHHKDFSNDPNKKSCDSLKSMSDANVCVDNTCPEYDVLPPRRKIWKVKPMTQLSSPPGGGVKEFPASCDGSASILKPTISEEELKKRTPLKKRQVWAVATEEPTCLKSSIEECVKDVSESENCLDANPSTSLVDRLPHSICNILAVNSADKSSSDCCSSEDQGKSANQNSPKKEKSLKVKMGKRNQRLNKRKLNLRFKSCLNKGNKIGVTIMRSTARCRSSAKSKGALKTKVPPARWNKAGHKKRASKLNHAQSCASKVADVVDQSEPISCENVTLEETSNSIERGDKSGSVPSSPAQLENCPPVPASLLKTVDDAAASQSSVPVVSAALAAAAVAPSCDSKDPPCKSGNESSTQPFEELTVDTSSEINEDSPPFSPVPGYGGANQQSSDWKKPSDLTVDLSLPPNNSLQPIALAGPLVAGPDGVMSSSSYSSYPTNPVLERSRSVSTLENEKNRYLSSKPKMRRESHPAPTTHNQSTTPIDLSHRRLPRYEGEIPEKVDTLDLSGPLPTFITSSGEKVMYNLATDKLIFEAPRGPLFIPPVKPSRSNVPIRPIPTHRMTSPVSTSYQLPASLPVDEFVPSDKTNFDLYSMVNNNYSPSAFRAMKNKMTNASSIAPQPKSNSVHHNPLLYTTSPANNYLFNAAGCSSVFLPIPSTSGCGAPSVSVIKQNKSNRSHKVRGDILSTTSVITSSKVGSIMSDVGRGHKVPHSRRETDVKLHKAQNQLRKRNPELSITRTPHVPLKASENKREGGSQQVQSTNSDRTSLTRELINFMYKTEGKALEPLDVVICELNEAKNEPDKPKDKSRTSRETSRSRHLKSSYEHAEVKNTFKSGLDEAESSSKVENGGGCHILDEVTVLSSFEASVGIPSEKEPCNEEKQSIPPSDGESAVDSCKVAVSSPKIVSWEDPGLSQESPVDVRVCDSKPLGEEIELDSIPLASEKDTTPEASTSKPLEEEIELSSNPLASEKDATPEASISETLREEIELSSIPLACEKETTPEVSESKPVGEEIELSLDPLASKKETTPEVPDSMPLGEESELSSIPSVCEKDSTPEVSESKTLGEEVVLSLDPLACKKETTPEVFDCKPLGEKIELSSNPLGSEKETEPELSDSKHLGEEMELGSNPLASEKGPTPEISDSRPLGKEIELSSNPLASEKETMSEVSDSKPLGEEIELSSNPLASEKETTPEVSESKTLGEEIELSSNPLASEKETMPEVSNSKPLGEEIELSSNPSAIEKETTSEVCVSSPNLIMKTDEIIPTSPSQHSSNKDCTFQVPGSGDIVETNATNAKRPSEEMPVAELPVGETSNCAKSVLDNVDVLHEDPKVSEATLSETRPCCDEKELMPPSRTSQDGKELMPPCESSKDEKELIPPSPVKSSEIFLPKDNPSSFLHQKCQIPPSSEAGGPELVPEQDSIEIPSMNDVPSHSANNVILDISEGVEQKVIVEEPTDIALQVEEIEKPVRLEERSHTTCEYETTYTDLEETAVQVGSIICKEGKPFVHPPKNEEIIMEPCSQTVIDSKPEAKSSEVDDPPTSLNINSSRETESLKIVYSGNCAETKLDNDVKVGMNVPGQLETLTESLTKHESVNCLISPSKEHKTNATGPSIVAVEFPGDDKLLCEEAGSSIISKTDVDVPISLVPCSVKPVSKEPNSGEDKLEDASPVLSAELMYELPGVSSGSSRPNEVSQSELPEEDNHEDAPEMYTPLRPQVKNVESEAAAPEVARVEVGQPNAQDIITTPSLLDVAIGTTLTNAPVELAEPSNLNGENKEEATNELPSSVVIETEIIENIPKEVSPTDTPPKELAKSGLAVLAIEVVKSNTLTGEGISISSSVLDLPPALEETYNQPHSVASEITPNNGANGELEASNRATIIESTEEPSIVEGSDKKLLSKATVLPKMLTNPLYEVTTAQNCDEIRSESCLKENPISPTTVEDSAEGISSSDVHPSSGSDPDTPSTTGDFNVNGDRPIETSKFLKLDPREAGTPDNPNLESTRLERKRKHPSWNFEEGEIKEKMCKPNLIPVEEPDNASGPILTETTSPEKMTEKDLRADLPNVTLEPLTRSLVQRLRCSGISIHEADMEFLRKGWMRLDDRRTFPQEITAQSARISEIDQPKKGPGKETTRRNNEDSPRPSTSADSYYEDVAQSAFSRSLLEASNNVRKATAPARSKHLSLSNSILLELGKKGQKRTISEAFAPSVFVYKDPRVTPPTVAHRRPPATVRDLKFQMVPIRSYSWILEHLREMRKKDRTDETVLAPNLKDFIRPLPESRAGYRNSDCSTSTNVSHSRLQEHDVFVPSHASPSSSSRIPTFIISSDSEDSNPGGAEDCLSERDEVRRRIRRKSGSSPMPTCSCPKSSPSSSRNACPTCRKERYYSQGAYSPVRSSRPPLYTKVNHVECHEPERVMKCAATVGGSEDAIVMPDHDSDLKFIKALMTMNGRSTPSTASPTNGTWRVDFDALRSEDPPVTGGDSSLTFYDEPSSLPALKMSLSTSVPTSSSRPPEVAPDPGAAFQQCLQQKPTRTTESPGPTVDTTSDVQTIFNREVSIRPPSFSMSRSTSETSLRRFRAALSTVLKNQPATPNSSLPIGCSVGNTDSPGYSHQHVPSTSANSGSPSHPTTPAEYMPFLKQICAELPSKETNELVQYLLQGPPSKKRKS